MKKFNFFVVLAMWVISQILMGCGEKMPDGDLDEVKMYCDFPKVVSLAEKNGERVDIDAMGIMDFKLVDSLLFVSTQDKDGLWKLYSLPNLDSVGNTLKLGSGPLELAYPMPINQASFESGRTYGKRILDIPQFDKRQIISIDLMASLDSAKLIGMEKEMPQVPVFPVLYYSLPDDYSYMMSVDPDELRIKRELFKGNVATESKVLSVLNGNKVDNMEDIGALTSFPLIQPGGSKVADCQGNRGIINVFDYLADTGFSLVGCGVETDMESSLERRDKNMSEYGGGNGYKDFFAVIANDYDNGQLTGQSLLFFDWEGNPLVKVILPMKNVGCFDIDLDNKMLYLHNIEEDCIVRCNFEF